MFEDESKAQGFMLPIRLFNSVEDKIERIRRDLTPYLARKKFRFKRGSPGVALLLGQLRGFPTCDFDDGPNALQMAFTAAKHLWQVGG
jgi:predicted phage terminase large subunit-like protein